MGFSSLFLYTIISLILSNSIHYAIIVFHNTVWVACIFRCYITIILCICIQGETLIKYYLSIYLSTCKRKC